MARQIVSLTVAALAVVLALNGILALGIATRGNKASNKLLRSQLTQSELTPDQVRDLLTAVADKQDTYVGDASVALLLTHEEFSLDRCTVLGSDKHARARFGLCNIHNLDYVPSVLGYCRDRLAKQADLCATHIDQVIDSSVKIMTQAEIETVKELTQTILTETEAADYISKSYKWDTLEDATKLHFWRQPKLASKKLPVLARGCAMVVRTVGAIQLVPKYARYFGSVGLEGNKQLEWWMSALQVCRAYNDLYETINQEDKSQIFLTEAKFGWF